jgi:hypothetical protein
MSTVIIFLHKSSYIHIRYSFGKKSICIRNTVIRFYIILCEKFITVDVVQSFDLAARLKNLYV